MLSQILQLILCLSILVILHELGHFFPAKLFKTKIEKFYLFFNPWFSLIKKKIGETEYGIGWLPFGGYVKIAGMVDENLNQNLQLKAKPWEYRSKKSWQKLIIILGGVTVNFLFSWFIFSLIFTYYGYNYISFNKFQKNGLSFSEIVKQVGFQEGDKILYIDGQPVKDNFNNVIVDFLLSDSISVQRNSDIKIIKLSDEKIKNIFKENKSNLISPFVKKIVIDSVLSYQNRLFKNDEIISINNKPLNSVRDFKNKILKSKNQTLKLGIIRNQSFFSTILKVPDTGILGISIKNTEKNNFFMRKKITFLKSIPISWNHMINVLYYQIKQFKIIARPKTEAYKQTMGPLRMFLVFDTNWNWELFWNLSAVLSIWLAFVNLLPIPGLDGGHAIFILFELITGKEASEKTIDMAQKIGFTIIVCIMVFIFGNDILYWIHKFI